MAKDSKKEKIQKEPKVDPKDKDIHLNLVGVPKKNVNVKKTYPRQNNEEYQLYRISIDTKGKEKDRKLRVGSLEPSPKKTTNRKRYKSDADDVVSSDDSYADLSRAPKSRKAGGLRGKPSTPIPRRKSVDSEICITIPGEKGKAIRIVGSSTRTHDETSSRDSSLQRSKRKRSESPRQVGFAKLDEVYGTSPEGTSLDSRGSLPYRKHSPQVYKIEKGSPTSVFKDPSTSKYVPERSGERRDDNPSSPKSTSDPKSTLDERSKRSSQQAETRSLSGGVPRAGSLITEAGYPSTSKGSKEVQPESSPSKQSGYSRLHPVNDSVNGTSSNVPTSSHATSNYEPETGTSAEMKGKYPFYPYDKQKRGKSPSKQFQESYEQEDVEPYTSQKLPSIPEVQSTEIHPSGSVGVTVPPKESSVLTRPTTRSNEVNKSPSPVPIRTNQNNVPISQSSSRPLPKQDQDTQGSKPTLNDPSKLSQTQKPINSTPSNSQRDSLGNNSIPYSTSKLNQPHEPSLQISQSTSPMTPKLQRKIETPVVQRTPAQIETSRTDYRPELQNTPSTRARQSSLKESSESKLRAVESPRESMYKKDHVAANNKNPVALKQPEVVDKQMMTDKVLQPRERILLEINEELNKKNSSLNQNSLQGSTKTNVSSTEKDPKRKSKLSNFVSSIPKPLFRRNKSLEKKGADKSAVAVETPTKLSSLEKNPNITKGQVNKMDEARKPVKESAIVKQAHEPVVEAYPSWVSSPGRQYPEKRGDDFQSQGLKGGPLSDKNANKHYSKEFLAHRMDESSSVEIASRSYDDHPLTRKSSRAPLASEEMKRSSVAYEEQDHPQGMVEKGVGSSVESWKPLTSGKNRSKLEDSHGNGRKGLGSTKSPDYNNYNRSQMTFEGTDVMEFQGKTLEKTPFGYGPQFAEDQQEENQAMASLEDGFEASKMAKKDKPYPSTHLVDRNPSLVSRASRSPEEELKKTLYVQPVQVMNASAGSHHITQTSSHKEASYGSNQKVSSKDRAYEHEPKADKRSTVSKERPGDDVKIKSLNKNPFGKAPAEQEVYVEHAPPTTYTIFNPDDSIDELSLHKEEVNPVTTPGKGPTGESSPPTSYSIYSPSDSIDERSLGKAKVKPVTSQGKAPKGESAPPATYSMYTPANSIDERSLDKEKVKPVTAKGKGPEGEHASPTTYTTYNPGDSIDGRSLDKVKPVVTTQQRKTPKGILIFVNKKNETTSPFEKSSSPPKKEGDSKKGKQKPGGSKKENKRRTSSSGDTSASASVQSSSYGGGDKKGVLERSPSGRRLTQKFPCGCIRIITLDPKKKLTREELITAYCVDGSQCEIRKTFPAPSPSQLWKSKDSSSVSWEGSRPGGRSDTSDPVRVRDVRDTFPDIEVIADGVLSRKPIKPRTPAPTMNGAKLTGSLKIQSNKVNGVCNFYLDRKLKTYLRNNMDKIKELLEDDDRRTSKRSKESDND